MPKTSTWIVALFLLLLIAPWLAAAETSTTAADDPRHVANGLVIPDEGYCDQPYVVVTKDGNWLCVLTTGAGVEGRRGQHVVSTISKDRGQSWSKPLDIEPADGPEASWATPLLTPSGRVYVFYDYNGDDVRSLKGKPVRADMLGWYCYRYSDDHGASWSATRHRLNVRVTDCDRRNDWNGNVQLFWGISKPIVVGDSALLAFTKLGKHLLENGEGWFFRSDNILTELDPSKLHFEMLPSGEHGLRNDRFGSVQEEHNVVSLQNGDLYCIYRTTTGYPCQAYSRDSGRSWTEPEHATYSPGGNKIKHPRACPKIWRTSNGKYLLWYHNHGGKTFEDRNPAWLCGGVEREGMIHWSQPEVLLYDDDPKVRMSYPDLIEQDGRYWITETQKTVARVHAIDRSLVEGLWRELEEERKPVAAKGASMAKDPVVSLTAEQLLRASETPLPRLPSLTYGRGFSVEMRLRFGEPAAGQVLLDSMDAAGHGLRISTHSDGRLQIEFSDGRTRGSWASDKGLVVNDTQRYVVITVDGGPKLITFIVDGVVCDGGLERQFGWGRFDKQLEDVNGNTSLKIASPSGGAWHSLRIHGRPLRNYEAIASFHAQGDF